MKITIAASDGIDKKFISETDMGDYVVRKEIWTLNTQSDPDKTPMESAYTKDGAYIGNVKDAKRLVEERGIIPEVSDPTHTVCSIGYCEREGKWYGWSHRAIYGFKVGSKVKKGDCAYTPEKGEWIARTDSEAKQMAKDFASSVSSSPKQISVKFSISKELLKNTPK